MSTKKCVRQPFPGGNIRNWELVARILDKEVKVVSGRKIIKLEERITPCCTNFVDAYYQYQALRIRKNFPACLDDLSWDELKPVFMLLESFIEKKCIWCSIPPHYLTKKEKALIGVT